MTLTQILADVEIGEEVVSEVGVDVAQLEDNQPASLTFTPSPFGHKQNVTLAFTPVTPTSSTSPAPKQSTLAEILEEVELAEEVSTQVVGDLAALQQGEGISSSFPASVFGHAYTVAISSTPVAA